jgi:hypothetical protein
MKNNNTPIALTGAESITTSATSETQKLVFETLAELLGRIERLECDAVARSEESA